jgi:hypothetical protein
MEHWNGGMMQIRLWLDVLSGTCLFVTCLVKVLFPTNHSLNFPEPIIPKFHHSIIPIVSEAN